MLKWEEFKKLKKKDQEEYIYRFVLKKQKFSNSSYIMIFSNFILLIVILYLTIFLLATSPSLLIYKKYIAEIFQKTSSLLNVMRIVIITLVAFDIILMIKNFLQERNFLIEKIKSGEKNDS